MDGRKLLKSVIGKGILIGSCFLGSIIWANSSDEDETQSDSVEIEPELEGTFYGAILKADEKAALEFAREGWKVDVRNSESQTYLHLFAEDSDSKIQAQRIQLLIKCGADVNAKDNQGTTPLSQAMSFHRPKIAKILLDNGADPHDFHLFVMIMNDRYQRGFKAAQEELDLLLNAGANIDEPDPHGNTPLHHAVLELLPDMIQLYLDRGANVNATNHKGQTPLDIALKKRAAISDNDPECQDEREELDRIIALLFEHGAIEG
jgi:ankyrin repeat protein